MKVKTEVKKTNLGYIRGLAPGQHGNVAAVAAGSPLETCRLDLASQEIELKTPRAHALSYFANRPV